MPALLLPDTALNFDSILNLDTGLLGLLGSWGKEVNSVGFSRTVSVNAACGTFCVFTCVLLKQIENNVKMMSVHAKPLYISNKQKTSTVIASQQQLNTYIANVPIDLLIAKNQCLAQSVSGQPQTCDLRNLNGQLTGPNLTPKATQDLLYLYMYM